MGPTELFSVSKKCQTLLIPKRGRKSKGGETLTGQNW